MKNEIQIPEFMNTNIDYTKCHKITFTKRKPLTWYQRLYRNLIRR